MNHRHLAAKIGKLAQRMLFALGLLSVVNCGTSVFPAKTQGQQAPDSTEKNPTPAEEPLPPLYRITDKVEIRTTMGSVIVGLYGDDAPRTVANFLSYVDRGFYKNLIFHRVMPGFMIQGGGFDAELERAETDDPIQLEIIPGIKHLLGTASMARTSDPHSASSQFFICVADSPQLNGIYAAFGEVLQGIDTVQAMATLPTTTAQTDGGPMADVPLNPVTIEGIERTE